MKAERRAGKGGGKPAVVIDADALRILSKRLVPHSDMAALLGISETTLEAKIAECDELRLAIRTGLAEIKDRLRTTQLVVALGDKAKGLWPPNPTMLIWLGKTVLGQRERIGEGEGYEEPEDELTAVLTTKVMEFAAKACRERDRRESETRKEE